VGVVGTLFPFQRKKYPTDIENILILQRLAGKGNLKIVHFSLGEAQVDGVIRRAISRSVPSPKDSALYEVAQIYSTEIV